MPSVVVGPVTPVTAAAADSLPLERRVGWRLWTLPFVLPVALLAGAVVLYFTAGVPVSDLTKDPMSERKGMGMHMGALSNVGVMAWTATAAVCLFTACLLYRRRQRRRAAFLAAPGVVSTAVAKDDLFMLHEYVLPTYLSIPETAVYAVYLATMTLWLVVFRGEVARSPWPLLMAAAALLAGSMLMDKLPKFPVAHTATEDGMKFLGIFGWAGYFAFTSADLLTIDERQDAKAAKRERGEKSVGHR